MMKRNHTRLCASAAIAAVLALNSTPLFAQMAPAPTMTVEPAPFPTFPETTAAPAQPTIIVPEIEVAPVEETQAAPATSAEPAATTTRTQRTAPVANPAPAPRVRSTSPADPAPVAAEVDSDPVAAVPLPEAVAEPVAPVAADTTAAPAPANNDDSVMTGLAIFAGIAAIALAIWGFLAIGRRRPVDRRAAAVIERPVVAPRAPVVAEPAAVAAPATPTPINTVAPAPSLAHTGAAVPLPRTMPATFEERDQLLRRMVEAKPDRANPFTSPIQRRKRAKLILQSLGRDFGDRDPWIDLSQYPQNWPELGRRQAAA